MRPDQHFFDYQHLPPHLSRVSKPFSELAAHVRSTIPRNSDSDAALEHILEAQRLTLRSLRHPETSPTQPELDFGEGAGPAFEATHGRALDPG